MIWCVCVWGRISFSFLVSSLFWPPLSRHAVDTHAHVCKHGTSTHTRDVESKHGFEFISYCICSVSVLYDFPFCAGAFFFRGGATKNSKPLSCIEVRKRGWMSWHTHPRSVVFSPSLHSLDLTPVLFYTEYPHRRTTPRPSNHYFFFFI